MIIFLILSRVSYSLGLKADHKKYLTSRRNKHSFSVNSWSIEEQIASEITSLRGFEENLLKTRLLWTLWCAKKKFYTPGPPFQSKNIFCYSQESILISQFNFHKIGTHQFSPKPSQTSQTFFCTSKCPNYPSFTGICDRGGSFWDLARNLLFEARSRFWRQSECYTSWSKPDRWTPYTMGGNVV